MHSNKFNQLSMKTKILLSILTLASGSLPAAESSPKDEVIAGAKKLAEKENYGWNSTNAFSGFTSTSEGKANKDGVIYLAVTFGDNTTEAYLKGGKGAVKQPDHEWQSLTELENEEGPIQFLVRRLQTFKAPADQAQDLASKTKEIKKEGENYSSDFTDAGAKEVIAVDQDPLGMQGRKVKDNGPQEVWMKPLADGSRAVILFNRGTEAGPITVAWEDIGYPDHLSAAVRDLWQKKDLGKFTGKFSAPVASHGVVMVTVRP